MTRVRGDRRDNNNSFTPIHPIHTPIHTSIPHSYSCAFVTSAWCRRHGLRLTIPPARNHAAPADQHRLLAGWALTIHLDPAQDQYSIQAATPWVLQLVLGSTIRRKSPLQPAVAFSWPVREYRRAHIWRAKRLYAFGARLPSERLRSWAWRDFRPDRVSRRGRKGCSRLDGHNEDKSG